MKKQIKYTYLFTLIVLPCLLFAQRQQVIELSNLYKKGKLKSVNREIKTVSSDSGAYLKIVENTKEGIVWLPVKDFKKRYN